MIDVIQLPQNPIVLGATTTEKRASLRLAENGARPIIRLEQCRPAETQGDGTTGFSPALGITNYNQNFGPRDLSQSVVTIIKQPRHGV
jgi:hypothetical protein